jgi:hypothetical protein
MVSLQGADHSWALRAAVRRGVGGSRQGRTGVTTHRATLRKTNTEYLDALQPLL